MKRGSITVFLALTLVLVLSFIFSLLEGARVCCLKSRAELVSELCMQSMFGNYHAGMWEDYHLLFLDGSWQEGELSMDRFAAEAMETARENLSAAAKNPWNKGYNLVALELKDMTVNGFQLATDQSGKVFQSQVALQMQMEAAVDALEGLLKVKEQGSQAESQVEQKEQGWNQAWDAMDTAEQWEPPEESSGESEGEEPSEESGGESEGEEEPPGETGESEGEQMENPMEYVKGLKSSAVLSLVVKNPSDVSNKALQSPKFISDRRLFVGNWEQKPDTGSLDRLWLQYYIQNYFSNYTEKSEKGAREKALDYEMEYLLAGKDSDGANLETVVYELLGIREAMNFVTIMQDGEKKGLAYSIATAAVGFTGMPLLVKAVQIGILLAWAFVESVLDVRTLLDGKKVPFLKRADQWCSDLKNCQGTVESNSKSEEDGQGLTYTQYLQMLLFLLSEKTINYRCMDLMERNEGVRMDHMIQAVEGTFDYKAQPLFWRWNFVAAGGWDTFYMQKTTSMTYGSR